ncbi:hypothetical protein QZK25_17560 [Acinetobacter baumannii]|uniref:hypothetical protein n=1 Tax=Acinetobacter baumannii TaxID=470 RepID=UPI00215EDFB8|nr:hypothetical protein [Acinetobacter baumannii]MDN8280150.1 hypothetical protein [Acinetobacter baumannii]MDN8283842.1 hypothetical protein [Acinetobacter baumannii]
MDKPITFSEWLGTQGNMVLLHANCCRIAYEAGQQSQQAKVEELQKQLNEYMFVAETIDEMYVKEVQKSDELQKRVEWLEDRLKATDTLSKMRAAVIGSFNSQEFNARTRRKMMILKRAEQALKGEGQ